MRWHHLFIGLLCIITFTGCAQEQQGTTVTVGATLSLSGNDLSSISQAMQQGIDLAVDEINANGGIHGKTLNVIYEDDQLSSAKAATAAHKLVEVDRVRAGLIAGTNTAKAAAPVFEKAQIPQLVLWDVNQDLKDAGEYTYGIGFSTEGAGRAMAEFLYAKGIRRVAVIRHQDEWSQLIAESFGKRFEELGGTVVIDESVPVGTSDFKSLLLKAKGSEAIYAPLVGQLEILFRQAKETGYGGIVATGDSMTQDAIDSAQGAAEGVYFTNVFTPEDARLRSLEDAYVKKYGRNPDMLVFTALGYDGTMVLAQAMRESGTDSSVALHDALYRVKDFEGAAGNVTIHPDGFAEKFEPIFVVNNSQMIPIG